MMHQQLKEFIGQTPLSRNTELTPEERRAELEKFAQLVWDEGYRIGLHVGMVSIPRK